MAGTRFSIIFFVLIILIVPFFTFGHHLSKDIPFQNFPYAETALILLAFYFIYHQYRVLSFKKYSINHTAQHFREAVDATAIELNWEIDTLNQHQAIAYQKDIPMQSEGIRITILRDDTRIYFNSIIDPFFGSNPFSWGRHGKNLHVFSKNLVSITQGIDILEEVRQP